MSPNYEHNQELLFASFKKTFFNNLILPDSVDKIFSFKYFIDQQKIIIEGVKTEKEKKAALFYCFLHNYIMYLNLYSSSYTYT